MPLGEGWATGSGLLENEDVWVQGATFAFDAEYNSGQSACLVMNVQCADGRLEKVLLPVGNGWEPGPNGVSIRREDGNTTRQVQKQSAYGQWIESVKEIAGNDPNCMSVLEQRPDVREASVWLGLGFHVARKEENYNIKDRATGQMVERTSQRLIAESFLGVIGQVTAQPQTAAQPVAQAQAPVAAAPAPVAPAPVAAQAPAPPVIQPVTAPGAPAGLIAPPPPPGAGVATAQAPARAPVAQAPAAPAVPQTAVGGHGGSGDPVTMLQLTNIARTVPDHNAWMLAAFGVPGVMGSDLEAGITDQSDAGLFIRLRTGN